MNFLGVVLCYLIAMAACEEQTEEACERKRINPVWVDMSGELLGGMATRWRDDDIVVSVPAKSGTTWTMNIVHQLRSGGDEKMQDLYQEVPWLEFFETPYQTKQELYNRWDALPYWYPRAFKTHAAPPETPYDPNVRYVVVVRDPRDALVSFGKFVQKHTDESIEAWNLPPPFVEGMLRAKSLHPLFEGFAQKGKLFTEFVRSWWQHKDAKNVLMLHFADMKKDHIGSVKKIHDFLGFSLTEEQMKKVVHLTSFQYMKENGVKFTLPKIAEHTGIRILEKDGMVRKGAVGEHQKALPDDIREALMKTIEEELTPEQASWMLHGGGMGKTEL